MMTARPETAMARASLKAWAREIRVFTRSRLNAMDLAPCRRDPRYYGQCTCFQLRRSARF